MDTTRKNGAMLSHAIKMKVLHDFDEDRTRTKVELGKLSGISCTSVARILRNRQELESMSSEEHDKRMVGYRRSENKLTKVTTIVSAENEKENLTKTSTQDSTSSSPKKSDKKRRKTSKQKGVGVKKRSKKKKENYSHDELPELQEKDMNEKENNFVLVPGTGGENPEAEARFEEALKTLEQYVNTILHSDEIVQDNEGPPKCRLFSSLYELYDDLMESEKEIWRKGVC